MQLLLIDTFISVAECGGVDIPVIPAAESLGKRMNCPRGQPELHSKALLPKQNKKTTCLKPKEVVRDLNHDIPVNEAWLQFPKMLIFDCTPFEHSFSGPQVHFLL